MADEADMAFDFAEGHLAGALAAQKKKGSAALTANGSCHFCGNTHEMGTRLFCDTDCSGDWEHETELRRRQGLPPKSYSQPNIAPPMNAFAPMASMAM